MQLSDPVTSIRGIGDKTAESFGKLNIHTVEDLIGTYPRRYLGYGRPVEIRTAPELERITIMATVSTYVKVNKGPRYVLTTLSADDGTGSVEIVWFNSPYLRSTFHKGDTYCFTGMGDAERSSAGLSADCRSHEQSAPEGNTGGATADRRTSRSACTRSSCQIRIAYQRTGGNGHPFSEG